jgi:hypothetical protein
MKNSNIKIQCSEVSVIDLSNVLYRNLLRSKCQNYPIFLLKDGYAIISKIYNPHNFFYFFDAESQQLFKALHDNISYIEEAFLEHYDLYLVKNNSWEQVDLIFDKDITSHLRAILTVIWEVYLEATRKIFMFLVSRGGKEPILDNQYARFLFSDFQIQHKNMKLLLNGEINEEVLQLFKNNLQKAQENLVKLSGGRAYLLGDIHHINYCMMLVAQIYC